MVQYATRHAREKVTVLGARGRRAPRRGKDYIIGPSAPRRNAWRTRRPRAIRGGRSRSSSLGALALSVVWFWDRPTLLALGLVGIAVAVILGLLYLGLSYNGPARSCTA